MKRILLLGDRGKMGTAIKQVFQHNYTIIGKNTSNFNAEDFDSVEKIIEEINPEIVINTIAFMGIDPCEIDPFTAYKINTLFPAHLAKLSVKKDFLLVHFSTDAVFSDSKYSYYTEKDTPCPVNIYGITKYGADCFLQNCAKKFYIIRIGVLFGLTSKKTQFVEKMLEKIYKGEKNLRIANDIISSPSYNIDIALQIKNLIENKYPFGLYHVVNSGKASLYELMKEIAKNLGLPITIEKASYKDFPLIGKKNTHTPMCSIYLPALRCWKLAIKDYCSALLKEKMI